MVINQHFEKSLEFDAEHKISASSGLNRGCGWPKFVRLINYRAVVIPFASTITMINVSFSSITCTLCLSQFEMAISSLGTYIPDLIVEQGDFYMLEAVCS